MGVTIYLGVMLGKWIDGKISLEKRYFTILFTLISMLIAIYSVIAQLKRFNEK
jgi:membrane protein DedA with SNARE-associated domain